MGSKNSSKTNYRNSNRIILSILETIIRSNLHNTASILKRGLMKSHIIKLCRLKTTTAEKYLNMLENAGYIEKIEAKWGIRDIILYDITEKGKERYYWFAKITKELEEANNLTEGEEKDEK